MPIFYKIDVLRALKASGYSTYRIRKEALLGQSAVQQLRSGRLVSWANIDRICNLLRCQPGDILGHIEDGIDRKDIVADSPVQLASPPAWPVAIDGYKVREFYVSVLERGGG